MLFYAHHLCISTFILDYNNGKNKNIYILINFSAHKYTYILNIFVYMCSCIKLTE